MIDDAWKNFELSGSVTDYLNYRKSADAHTGRRESERMAVNGDLFSSEKGMSGYGTEHSSNRDDIKCNADW